jgi:quercetin dioxygenase-like cupin family protein
MSRMMKHGDDIPGEPGADEYFRGAVSVQQMVHQEAGPVRVARVTFAKGARTHWHVHAGEQVLYFLRGRGRVQMRGSGAEDATMGDVAHIPPGVEHWHGAHPEEADGMQHLAITFGETTWGEPVSAEEYQAGSGWVKE